MIKKESYCIQSFSKDVNKWRDVWNCVDLPEVHRILAMYRQKHREMTFRGIKRTTLTFEEVMPE